MVNSEINRKWERICEMYNPENNHLYSMYCSYARALAWLLIMPMAQT